MCNSLPDYIGMYIIQSSNNGSAISSNHYNACVILIKMFASNSLLLRFHLIACWTLYFTHCFWWLFFFNVSYIATEALIWEQRFNLSCVILFLKSFNKNYILARRVLQLPMRYMEAYGTQLSAVHRKRLFSFL